MIIKNSKVYINKNNLFHNINSFKNIIDSNVKFCAVIKGNAYGHGLIEVGKILDSQEDIDYLAVNYIQEGIALRKADIKKRILVLCESLPEEYLYAINNNLEITISEISNIKILGSLNKECKVHIKIDTGAGRLGVLPENLYDFIKEVQKYSNIKISGIMTHFSNIEDVDNQEYAFLQLKRFKLALSEAAKIIDINNIIKHCAASSAVMLIKDSHYDMVRIGIGMYGLWPSEKTFLSMGKFNKSFKLEPVLSWKTQLINVKDLKKGEYIGYGCTYRLTRDSKIGIIPVGYYEGFDRLLSNKCDVLIKGKRCPVIGRVSMHMTVVDLTDISDVYAGDDVVIIGSYLDNEISAQELARRCSTINYEIVTRINENILREFI